MNQILLGSRRDSTSDKSSKIVLIPPTFYSNISIDAIYLKSLLVVFYLHYIPSYKRGLDWIPNSSSCSFDLPQQTSSIMDKWGLFLTKPFSKWSVIFLKVPTHVWCLHLGPGLMIWIVLNAELRLTLSLVGRRHLHRSSTWISTSAAAALSPPFYYLLSYIYT